MPLVHACILAVCLAPPDASAERARELYAANHAQHFLSAEVQVPALRRALELRQRQQAVEGEPLTLRWSLADVRDLLFIWTQWYGLERDNWLFSDASIQSFFLELSLPPDAPESGPADMLRSVGGCDAYVIGDGRLFAFASGSLADVDMHEDLLATACRLPDADFLCCSELRARDADDPAPSLLWLSGRCRSRHFEVAEVGLAGVDLAAAALPNVLASYQRYLSQYAHCENEDTGLITLDLPTPEAARALGERIDGAKGRSGPTWRRGRRLQTYHWDTHLALVSSHDHFAPGERLFPPTPATEDQIDRRKRERILPVSFWSGGRARARAIRWAVVGLVIAVCMAAAIALWRARRRAARTRRTPR